MRPVVAIYSTFLQRGYDQIVHDVALPRLPVTLALDRSGLVGEDGPTHHGTLDLCYLRHIPGLVVMAPKDLAELAAMVRTALELGGPAAIRYPRGEGTNPPQAEVGCLEIGRAEALRAGDAAAVIAVGAMVAPALSAAELLARRGIEVAVVNARFIKPLDEDLLCELAERCGRLVTVEENAVSGGFGSAVQEMLQRRGLVVPVLSLGVPDRFIEHGRREQLLAEIGLDPDGLAGAIKRFLAIGGRSPGSGQAHSLAQ
jgi:1-deoxy-D-xylulose-5-phosphate synthase